EIKEWCLFFDFATEDFPVALLRGGKGLPEAGYESVEAEARENIRTISNQVNDGVGNVGDGNIGLKIDSGGGSITIGADKIPDSHNYKLKSCLLKVGLTQK
ncbi:MAG: hypothetical protein AAFX46_23350, partial [Cyanobacteria bacterium J06636_27]